MFQLKALSKNKVLCLRRLIVAVVRLILIATLKILLLLFKAALIQESAKTRAPLRH